MIVVGQNRIKSPITRLLELLISVMNNHRWKKLDKLVIANPRTTIVIVSSSATNVVLDVRDGSRN